MAVAQHGRCRAQEGFRAGAGQGEWYGFRQQREDSLRNGKRRAVLSHAYINKLGG
jgi:hypothetical protein